MYLMSSVTIIINGLLTVRLRYRLSHEERGDISFIARGTRERSERGQNMIS